MQFIQVAKKYHLAKAFSVRLYCISSCRFSSILFFPGHYLGMAFERISSKVTTTICLDACDIERARLSDSAKSQVLGITYEQPWLLLSDTQNQDRHDRVLLSHR